ncbi:MULTISPECIES: ABC transporter ATP-binding protein [Alicyclobacillus]|uniref:Iron(III) transport system ATP-binding protein/energy-coupling factor transport system ATP-binding protein n=1 Tax=Alicyclobacillus vulcanalis TaxID=252246 RepID=A0A1N7PNF9_9BACL|nr:MULTISPECIES: ABC transporter ATP-binding protein [Alicyclobacillus]SIT12174.1 iron(III) transport system ATP-binding protein/energy-coupling factor transport system ATP-binding protein [Alicyclobacillus vulcanalis]
MANAPHRGGDKREDGLALDGTALVWRHLSVAPAGVPQPVLTDASGEIPRGQMVAVVGPNGAGKTTFLRALVGLASFRGELWVHGEPWHRARWRIQMGFQPPAATFVGQTVEEEMAIAVATRAARTGEPPPDRPKLDGELRRWMQTVGLHVPVNRPVDALSGGEMAKLAVAGALASGADILLLDETQAELDPGARADMRAVFQGLARSGRTILLVTHDMDDVLAADAVMVIREGTIGKPMPPRDFFYGWGERVPCDDLGFQAPYLVQVARDIRAATGADFAPLSEREFVEGWRDAVAGAIRRGGARRNSSAVEHLV